MKEFIVRKDEQVTLAEQPGDYVIYNCNPFGYVQIYGEPNSFLFCELGPLSKAIFSGVKKLFASTRADVQMTVMMDVASLERPDDEAETPEVIRPLRGKKFFLDAGHGGKDPGAVNSVLTLEEKVAALDIVHLLASSLSNFGAEVKFSREGDTYPTINQRAEAANVWGATGFISIHLNSADSKTANGIETLCYSKNSTAGKWAALVQDELVAETKLRNRGVKERPDLGVLKYTRMPAILCEVGFISNDEEARLLFNPSFQLRIAGAITEGTLSQFGG